MHLRSPRSVSPRLALWLLPLLATAPAAQDVLDGYASSSLPNAIPALAQGETVPLPDGGFLAFDGSVLERWNAAGTGSTTLHVLGTPGTPGALAVDAAGARALIGVRESGQVLLVDVAGTTATTQVAVLFDNRSATFVDAQTAYVSAGSPTVVSRIDLATGGGAAGVIGLPGQAGPLANDGQGGLLVATVSESSPAPADSASVRAFSAATLASPPSPVFQEQDGLIVVQIETAPVVSQWKEETSQSGYTGDSYYRWNGPNQFNSPGNGILTYQIEAVTGGYYNWRIFNYHVGAPDQNNDCWVRMDGGPWHKAFSNDGPSTVGVWNWTLKLEGEGGSPPAFFEMTPGVHTLQISARSFGFHMDRMHFYKPGSPGALSLENPQSPLAALGQGASVEVAGGLDGITGLTVDPASGTTYVSEVNSATGVNRVASVSGPGVPPATLAAAPASEPFGRLDFVPGSGPGIFFAFQPTGGGQVVLERDGAAGPERAALAPERPTLTLSGPGTSGVGEVELTVLGGAPGDFLFVLAAPAAGTLAAEQSYLFSGLPLVWSALDPQGLVIVPTSAVFQASGAARTNFYNTLGLVGTLELQGLVLRLGVGVDRLRSTPPSAWE